MPERHEEIDELVAAVRDGDGDEEAAQRLADTLRDRPELRQRYLKQMLLSSLLREAVGEEQVVQRSERRRWVVPVIAAAAIIVAMVAFWPRTDSGLVATLDSADGSILIDGESASIGATISPGQALAVRGSSPSASFTYPDGTRVLIDGGSELELSKADHKHIVITRGVLHADVAKQPPGRPMRIITPSAELEILGTRFVVGAGDENTDLNVIEGLVRMKRTDGDAVDVAAGERARFSAGYSVEISTLEEVPTTWNRDFEQPSGNDWSAETITEELPPGSNGGLGTKSFVLERDGQTYHRIAIRDLVDGYCKITENTHLQLTFRTREWFNLFIGTIGPDENGKMQVRKFKLGASNLYRWADVEDEWHSLTVPLTAFTERTGIRQPEGSPGRRPEHDGYGGPPPEPGHVIHTILMSHPEPFRDLQIDAVGFTPSGPGKKVLKTISR